MRRDRDPQVSACLLSRRWPALRRGFALRDLSPSHREPAFIVHFHFLFTAITFATSASSPSPHRRRVTCLLFPLRVLKARLPRAPPPGQVTRTSSHTDRRHQYFAAVSFDRNTTLPCVHSLHRPAASPDPRSMSSQSLKPRRSSTALDPYAAPHIYYGDHTARNHARARTYSAVSGRTGPQ